MAAAVQHEDRNNEASMEKECLAAGFGLVFDKIMSLTLTFLVVPIDDNFHIYI